MNIQLNMKINRELFRKAEQFAVKNGFLNVQEMIRHMIREKILEDDGFFNVSMESFSKEWMSDDDEKAWRRFQ